MRLDRNWIRPVVVFVMLLLFSTAVLPQQQDPCSTVYKQCIDLEETTLETCMGLARGHYQLGIANCRRNHDVMIAGGVSP